MLDKHSIRAPAWSVLGAPCPDAPVKAWVPWLLLLGSNPFRWVSAPSWNDVLSCIVPFKMWPWVICYSLALCHLFRSINDSPSVYDWFRELCYLVCWWTIWIVIAFSIQYDTKFTSALIAYPNFIALVIAPLFATGSAPGSARHVGQVL